MKKLFSILLLSVCAALPAVAQKINLPTQTRGVLPVANGGTGTTTAGVNNISTYASGISIGDGFPHIVSAAPAGTPFNGVTTLAGIAAISIGGATPFSWITSAPFTGAGAYALVNADVPNLDIAWLALQAGLISGKAYVPAGTYIVGSVKILPLYRPLNTEAAGGTTGGAFLGDGPGVTFIEPGFDWGSGKGLIYCGDPQGTVGNSLGRYATTAECSGKIADMTLQSSAGNPLFTIGATTIAMDGFMWGGRWQVDNVTVAGFNHNFSLVGDHTLLSRLHSFGGTVGIYWDAPSASLHGDVTFNDLRSEGASQSAIAVHSAATIAGAVFNGETYLSAPNSITFEGGSCTAAMSGVVIDNLFTEFTGNAVISDESGLSAGTWTEASKCRNIIKLHIDQWFNNWSNSKLWTTGGRGRRATIDAAQIYMKVDMMSGAGAQMAPTSPSSGPTPIATFNIKKRSVDGFAASEINGDIGGWTSQNTGTGLGIPLVVLQTGNPLALNYNGTPANGPDPVIGTTISLTAPKGTAICTGTCTVTLPVPALGYEFCILNDDNVATVITLAALGSSARYENTARTAYGTATTGTLVSTAAAGSRVCLLGRDSTHYLTVQSTGSWTAN